MLPGGVIRLLQIEKNGYNMFFLDKSSFTVIWGDLCLVTAFITNWNNLPAALKFANNTNLFKNLLDKDLKFKVQFTIFPSNPERRTQ